MTAATLARPRSLAAILAVALPLLLACWAGSAGAGSFQVNPVRVDLGPGTTSASVVVRNDGADPVVVQASAMRWTQQDGVDVYEVAPETIVVPPIATIAPGATQIVRIGLRRAPDPSRELAYRLYVQELPPPSAPGFSGLQVALRIGLPVFVAPSTPASARVEWSAQRDGDAKLRLTARNLGNAHLQISDFALYRDGGGEPIARESLLSYVLAGETRHWVLPLAAATPPVEGTVRMRAWTDAGELDLPVAITR
jgi:fimbrial chaperone protein